MSVNYHAFQSRGVPFQEYEAAARQWQDMFSGFDPSGIAGILHLASDEKYLYLSYFSVPYRLHLEDGHLEKKYGDGWTDKLYFNETMAIYHTLCYTKEHPVISGIWVPGHTLDGVVSRNRNVKDPLFESFCRRWTGRTEELRQECIKAGGTPLSRGDLSFQFEVFPWMQIQLIFWDADEDFPAQVQVLVDERITDFIHYETVGCIISDLFEKLENSGFQVSSLALDLDRTALNGRGRLSARTRKAIESAAGKGIQVIIASGRALNSLPEDVLAVKSIRYAVTSNGAAVYDLHTRRCMKQYKMTEKSVCGILELTKELPIAYEAFIDGKPYGQKEYVEDPVRFGATVSAIPYIQSTREPVENIREFLLSHSSELDSIDLVVPSEEMKQKLWNELAQTVPDLYITSSIRQLLEISYKDCGKHSGVRFLLEHLGLSPKGLVAFGDGDNDIDLLHFAGTGIAMKNGSAGCRAAADCIAASNDEDGVAQEIEKILARL